MKIQFALEGLMSVLSQMSNYSGHGSSKSFSVDCFFSLFDISSRNIKIHFNWSNVCWYGSAPFSCLVWNCWIHKWGRIPPVSQGGVTSLSRMWLLLEVLFWIADKTQPKVFCFAAVEFISCPHHAKLPCCLHLDLPSVFVSFFFIFWEWSSQSCSDSSFPLDKLLFCCL